MLIAVAAEKGGVGKTTISTNLAGVRATQGHSVAVVDTDVDETKGRYAYAWCSARKDQPAAAQLNAYMLRGEDIYNPLLSYKEMFDTVIVDLPAGNSVELRLACAAADVVVIPLRVGQYDTNGLSTMLSVANEWRQTRPEVRFLAVLSDVPFNAVSDLRDSVEMLDGVAQYVTRTRRHIVGRQAFRNSARAGLAVTELSKSQGRDPKADADLLSLYEEVFND